MVAGGSAMNQGGAALAGWGDGYDGGLLHEDMRAAVTLRFVRTMPLTGLTLEPIPSPSNLYYA